jgi:hypothetical protein
MRPMNISTSDSTLRSEPVQERRGGWWIDWWRGRPCQKNGESVAPEHQSHHETQPKYYVAYASHVTESATTRLIKLATFAHVVLSV